MFLWVDLPRLITHPFEALPEIDRRRSLLDGALALGLSVSAPAILAELAGLAPYRAPAELGSLPSLTAQGLDIYARWVYQHRFLIPVLESLGSTLLWVASGAVIHACAHGLKGTGSLRGFLKLLGFVSLTGLIVLPLSLIETLARLSSNQAALASLTSLVGLAGLAVFLWQNFLLVVAAQAHYRISMGRAVTAVLGPAGCLLTLTLILLVVGLVVAILTRPLGVL
jgi:hypothetical protein